MINALAEAGMDLRKKRILVTGGLGFIGSNLARRCVQLGGEVTVFDCLDPNSGGNLYNVHDVRDSLEIVYQDILNFENVNQHVLNKDLIFNCAASTSHPFSMREPWADLDVNSRGVLNLLEAVRRFNPEARFVHVGTTTQIGRLIHRPADETHCEFPLDIYSANKSVSEKYVLIYGNAYSMNTTVVRLSNIYGPRASIHSPEFTFNNYFIGLALQDRPITVYGDGRQLRNVLYVDDAVDALLMVANSTTVNVETLFAASDDHYSIADVAEATVTHIGTGRVEHVDWPTQRKKIEVGDAVISNAKIKSCIGWKPRVSLADGLAATGAYYRSCLNEYLR